MIKDDSAGPAPLRGRIATVARVALAMSIVAVVGTLAATGRLREVLEGARAWIDGLGSAGPAAFVALYALATVLAIPASLLTVAAGAMFGSVVGVASVSVGATLGAAASFAIARWIARDAIASRLEGNERFAKLDNLTERHGATIVAITRLVPLFPFVLLNYGFGLTKVRFWTYLGWSWLCMLPGTVLYVVGAAAITKGVREGAIPWPLVGIVAVVAAILVLLVRRARAKIEASEGDGRTSSTSHSSDPSP